MDTTNASPPVTTPPVRATVRTRDAARTRRSLLEAGLHRFAAEGYAATTVRHVADDAGVDVALIKRYFGSKEGLFEACLEAAVDDLRDQRPARTTAEVASVMARHSLGDPSGGHALLLLLRSSGDERVDAVRRRVLHQHSEQLARRLRPRTDDDAPAEASQEELLRAQVALATAVGIAVLRSSPGLDPLRSATPEQLAPVLEGVLRAAARGSPDAGAPPS